MYTPEKLLACPDIYWLSRVPETIGACAGLTAVPSSDIDWDEGGNGYRLPNLWNSAGDRGNVGYIIRSRFCLE